MSNHDKSQIRFVRIKGRIVPIKIKKGSGSRGGRLKASKNLKQEVAKGLVQGGSALTVAGLLTANKTLFKFRGFFTEFRRRNVSILRATEQAQLKLILTRRPFNKGAFIHIRNLDRLDLLKRSRKARIREAKFLLKARPIRITGRLLTLAGLAAMGVGIVLTRKGDRQRSRESIALNKLVNKVK